MHHPDRQKAVGGVRASPARPHSRTPALGAARQGQRASRATQKGREAPAPPNSSDACCFLPRTPFPRSVRGDKRAGDAHTLRFTRCSSTPPPSRIARGAPEVRPSYVRPDAAGPLGWQNSFKKNFKKKGGTVLGDSGEVNDHGCVLLLRPSWLLVLVVWRRAPVRREL